jgi:hypothetical protein
VKIAGRWARLSLFKQLHLARCALPRPSQARAAHVAEDPLYGAHRNPHVVNAPGPQLRALSAVLELAPRLLHELNDSRCDPAPSPPRIPRHQALEAALPPAHTPAPNRSSGDAIAPPRRRRAMKPCEVKHHQPLSHSPSVLQPDLHIAQSDHSPPLFGSSLPCKQEEVNLR